MDALRRLACGARPPPQVDNGLKTTKKAAHVIGKEAKGIAEADERTKKALGKALTGHGGSVGKAIGKSIAEREHALHKTIKSVSHSIEHTANANAKAKSDAVKKITKVLG